MKLFKLCSILIIILLIACNSDEKNKILNEKVSSSSNHDDTKKKIMKSFDEINEQDRLFGVPTGKIVFQYSGTWTGTETVWFDQYGKRVVMEQDIFFSKKNHQKVRIIWAGSKKGSLTCEYMSYGKEVNICFVPFMRPKDTELSIFSHGDESQLKYGYDKLGPKKFLGKEAQGWKSNSGDITGWIWQGIDVAYSNQGVEKTMLSFEDIDEIPEEMLTMPSGFSMN